jgi:hypothetical protein
MSQGRGGRRDHAAAVTAAVESMDAGGASRKPKGSTKAVAEKSPKRPAAKRAQDPPITASEDDEVTFADALQDLHEQRQRFQEELDSRQRQIAEQAAAVDEKEAALRQLAAAVEEKEVAVRQEKERQAAASRQEEERKAAVANQEKERNIALAEKERTYEKKALELQRARRSYREEQERLDALQRQHQEEGQRPPVASPHRPRNGGGPTAGGGAEPEGQAGVRRLHADLMAEITAAAGGSGHPSAEDDGLSADSAPPTRKRNRILVVQPPGAPRVEGSSRGPQHFSETGGDQILSVKTFTPLLGLGSFEMKTDLLRVLPRFVKLLRELHGDQTAEGNKLDGLKYESQLSAWGAKGPAETLRVMGTVLRYNPGLSLDFLNMMCDPAGNPFIGEIRVVGLILEALCRERQSRLQTYAVQVEDILQVLIRKESRPSLDSAPYTGLLSWFTACYLVCVLSDSPFSIGEWMWLYENNDSFESAVQFDIPTVKVRAAAANKNQLFAYDLVHGYIMDHADTWKSEHFLEIQSRRHWYGMTSTAQAARVAEATSSALNEAAWNETAPNTRFTSSGTQLSHHSPSVAVSLFSRSEGGRRGARNFRDGASSIAPSVALSSTDHPPLDVADYNDGKESRMAISARVCMFCGRSHTSEHVARDAKGKALQKCALFKTHPRFDPQHRFRLATEIMDGRQRPQPATAVHDS